MSASRSSGTGGDDALWHRSRAGVIRSSPETAGPVNRGGRSKQFNPRVRRQSTAPPKVRRKALSFRPGSQQVRDRRLHVHGSVSAHRAPTEVWRVAGWRRRKREVLRLGVVERRARRAPARQAATELGARQPVAHAAAGRDNSVEYDVQQREPPEDPLWRRTDVAHAQHLATRRQLFRERGSRGHRGVTEVQVDEPGRSPDDGGNHRLSATSESHDPTDPGIRSGRAGSPYIHAIWLSACAVRPGSDTPIPAGRRRPIGRPPGMFSFAHRCAESVGGRAVGRSGALNLVAASRISPVPASRRSRTAPCSSARKIAFA
jgi:hypothetical protein